MQLIFHEFFSLKLLGHTSRVGVMAMWCLKFDVQSHNFSRLCLLVMNGVPISANAIVRNLVMQKCLMMGMSIQKVLTFSSQEKVSHPIMHLVFHG